MDQIAPLSAFDNGIPMDNSSRPNLVRQMQIPDHNMSTKIEAIEREVELLKLQIVAAAPNLDHERGYHQ